MKILIASDIHGRVSAVKKLEAVIVREKPDRIVLLGDYLYNGPRNGVPEDYDPAGVAQILNQYASIAYAVRGNCDSRSDSLVLNIPTTDSLELEFNGKRIAAYHGDLDLHELFDLSNFDMVWSGHTHRICLQKENGLLFLNPGSISFPKGEHPASYAVFDDRAIKILSFEGDVIAFMDIK